MKLQHYSNDVVEITAEINDEGTYGSVSQNELMKAIYKLADLMADCGNGSLVVISVSDEEEGEE